MINLLHSINMEKLGGAEVQCLEFLENSNSGQIATNSLFLQSDGLYAAAGKRLANASVKIYRETHYNKIWIPPRPKLLRSLHRKVIHKTCNYDFLIIWSGLDGNGSRVMRDFDQARCVNWEHGGAWYPVCDPARTEFIKKINLSICNSFASRRMLELRWNFKGVSKVVHNGLRPSVVPSVIPQPRASMRSDILTLGIAARLTTIKGVPSALNALRILLKRGQDVVLLIAGEGHHKAGLSELASNLGLNDRVEFLGEVGNMECFYDSIDILLVPSIRESFGQVVLEAGIRGIPAIVSQVDGLPETVVDGTTGLVVPPSLTEMPYRKISGRCVGKLPSFVYDPIKDKLEEPKALDPNDLANAIEYLSRSPQTYADMSKAVQQHIVKNFDFVSKVAKVERILLDIAYNVAY